jgi:hypothetical protein
VVRDRFSAEEPQSMIDIYQAGATVREVAER